MIDVAESSQVSLISSLLYQHFLFSANLKSQLQFKLGFVLHLGNWSFWFFFCPFSSFSLFPNFSDYLFISVCFFSSKFKNCWLLPYWKLMNFPPVGRWTLINIYNKKYPMYPFFWSINIFINNLCCVNWNILKFAAKNPDAQDPPSHLHPEEVHLWWDRFLCLEIVFTFEFPRQTHIGQTREVFPEEQHGFGANWTPWLHVTG